jgi:hypothetical protein
VVIDERKGKGWLVGEIGGGSGIAGARWKVDHRLLVKNTATRPPTKSTIHTVNLPQRCFSFCESADCFATANTSRRATLSQFSLTDSTCGVLGDGRVKDDNTSSQPQSFV